MLTKIPTSAEWLALKTIGETALIIVFGLIVLMVLLLEWEDIKEEIQSIIFFFKPRKSKQKWNKQQHKSQ